MTSDFEQELKKLPLRPIPPEWRTRILANATSGQRQPVWLAFFWPHPAFWVCIAAAWVVIAFLSFTGPRGKDLYAFGPGGSENGRLSPEVYALYIARCAEFDLKRPVRITPLRRSEL